MNREKSTITLTFGDMAENHVGMERIGVKVGEGEGFDLKDLEEMKNNFGDCETRIYDLTKNAYVLVIKKGVDKILRDCAGEELGSVNSEDMFDEQSKLDIDKKAFMYGRVVNKYSQWNLCFDEFDREPDYENRKGRIVAFDSMPIFKSFKDRVDKIFGEKAKGLKGEANYYYDIKKCGIGFHGDAERRKVIGVRLGASLPLHYQWYYNGKAVGDRMIFNLEGGDIYVMSEKAVGTDWKKKKMYTLRHAAGCDKYTK